MLGRVKNPDLFLGSFTGYNYWGFNHSQPQFVLVGGELLGLDNDYRYAMYWDGRVEYAYLAPAQEDDYKDTYVSESDLESMGIDVEGSPRNSHGIPVPIGYIPANNVKNSGGGFGDLIGLIAFSALTLGFGAAISATAGVEAAGAASGVEGGEATEIASSTESIAGYSETDVAQYSAKLAGSKGKSIIQPFSLAAVQDYLPEASVGDESLLNTDVVDTATSDYFTPENALVTGDWQANAETFSTPTDPTNDYVGDLPPQDYPLPPDYPNSLPDKVLDYAQKLGVSRINSWLQNTKQADDKTARAHETPMQKRNVLATPTAVNWNSVAAGSTTVVLILLAFVFGAFILKAWKS